MHIKKNKKSNDVIIFLLPNFSGGGAERVAINLFLELYKRGHHIELIVFNDDGLSLNGDALISFLNGATHAIVALEKINDKVIYQIPVYCVSEVFRLAATD